MAEQRTTRTRAASDGGAAADKPKRRRVTKQAADSSVAEKEPPEALEADVEEPERETPKTRAEASGPGAAGRDERTVREELRSVIREAALEVLTPVARQATSAAAKYAVANGPKLAKDAVAPRLKDALAPRIEESGGAAALARGALSKVSEAGGGVLSKVGVRAGAGRATGKGLRLPLQESVDVAVPLETAYNQFTQFEEFPEFMRGVEEVEQRDDTHLLWQRTVLGSPREWEVEITEQRPNERIAWEGLGGTEIAGVVTFHRLSDRLTRIEVSVDFEPEGLLEKTASGLRIARRALKKDLMRFKAFIEMREKETGAWRGHVGDGEIDAERGTEDEHEARGDEQEEDAEGPVARKPAAEPEEDEEGEPEAGDRDFDESEEEEPEPEAGDRDFDESEEEEPEPEAEDRELDEPEPEEEAQEDEEEEPEPEREPAARKRRVRRRAPAQGRRR